MDPNDDPEARIRELEQASGGDRAVELGVGQSGPTYSYVPPGQSDSYVPPPVPSSYPLPPPPLPPPSAPPSGYGPPSGYPPPVQQTWSAAPTPPPAGAFSGANGYMRPSWGTVRRSGSRRLVWIPVAIGLFAFGPGLLSLVSHAFDTGVSHNSSGPTPSGGGGFTFAPTTAAAPTTPPAGSSQSVSGISDNKTVICNDNDVTISGSSNTITVTGRCASVTVAGTDNVVVLDSAESITASGFDNKVTYHSGTPHITNPVDGNVIEQG
jgi:hypothetical protein